MRFLSPCPNVVDATRPSDAFGVAQSSVVFYNEDSRARAESLARSIGVANVQFTDRPGSSIEVTVTIGADFTP